MSSSAVLGQYLWHELLTSDPQAGTGFYSKVLGWSKVPYEGDAGYTMLGNAQGPVGGARVMGKDALADQAGPSWLTYVGVPDLTAALATVEAKGGRILHPITPVPGDGGRYAVIVDPQGAKIGVYEPGAGMSGGADAAAGPVVWHELTAADPEAALQFYNAIFGWEVVATHEMGGDVGTYYLFGQGATQKGGAYAAAKPGAGNGPRWLVYLGVPSVTAAVEAAKAAGGKVLNPPHQVPGGSWISQLLDSHGVAVAVHGPLDAAAAAPKAPAQPKAKAKVKTKAKPVAIKAKSKVPSQPKSKAKAKSKASVKRKVATKSKAKTQIKRAAKAKPKVKGKSKAKAKTKVRAKTKAPARGRKQARRGK
jgi:predicted enzyme related to lactoylglutathione lyase